LLSTPAGVPDGESVVRVDRHGFAIGTTQEITEEESRLRQQESEIGLRREQQWIQMMAHWDDFETHHPDKLELRFK
jgi:hypothetical protein